MKTCPKCSQTYSDESLNYCLNDGTVLISGGDAKTAEMNYASNPTSNNPTARYTNYTPAPSQATVVNEGATFVRPSSPGKSNAVVWVLLILGGLVLVCGGGFAGIYAFYLSQNHNTNLSSNDLLANKSSNSTNTTVPSLSKTPQPADSDSKGLTMEKYSRLEMKSSYEKVVEILGSEGVEMSSSGSGAYKSQMFKWSNSETEFIIVLFLNDKLTNKTQAGLNKNIDESLSLAKYNQLKDGMKYEEVTAILGEGVEMSKTEIMGSNVVSYQWRGSEFSQITLSFQNGKMNSKSQYGLK